jgi:hypothetical protein
VIIRECKHFQTLFRGEYLSEYTTQILQIAFPADYGFISNLRLGLDGLTVAKSTDINPVSRCQV